MTRVVHRIIGNKYVAIHSNILLEETTIPFDCHIKRFDDYVIIIEAGSFIHKELCEKISHNELIYVLKHDMHKISEYNKDFKIIERDEPFKINKKKAIDASLGLGEELSDEMTYEERLAKVYMTTSELMRVIFEGLDENLPLDALHSCTHHLTECVNNDINIMPLLFKIMPEEYSTHHHSTNVSFFSCILSKAIHISSEDVFEIALAGLLHDIGKIRIDTNILLKPTGLEEDEYELIKKHSDDGLSILQSNGIASQKILNGVHYHHEKLNGTGYPKGLKGKTIPQSARIIGMCDVFDALITKRTYRENYTSFHALLLIKKEMHTQFDELYTDTFIQLLR
jgi:HD-GYP domain-containing protein (c-di-GMP phosphodiesterase class II)